MSFDAETSAHRAAQRVHAMKQCRARHGTQLSMGQYLNLCDLVWACAYGAGADEAMISPVGFRNRNRYLIKLGGRYVCAVWSEVTMQIATFLPVSCELSERDLD